MTRTLVALSLVLVAACSNTPVAPDVVAPTARLTVITSEPANILVYLDYDHIRGNFNTTTVTVEVPTQQNLRVCAYRMVDGVAREEHVTLRHDHTLRITF